MTMDESDTEQDHEIAVERSLFGTVRRASLAPDVDASDEGTVHVVALGSLGTGVEGGGCCESCEEFTFSVAQRGWCDDADNGVEVSGFVVGVGQAAAI